MRKIEALYILAFGLLMAFFHSLFFSGKVLFGHVNIFLFPLAIAAYILPRAFLLWLSALSFIALYPFFILVYKPDGVNAALPAITFAAMLLGAVAHKAYLEKLKEGWEAKINGSEAVKQGKLTDFEKVIRIENDVKDREQKIISLYEITKQMSGSLKFEDIFNVLGSFMKDNFTFMRCELIILKAGGPAPALDRCYSIWYEEPSLESRNKTDHEALIRMMARKEEVAYITRESDPGAFKELRLAHDVGELAMIPLMSEKKMAAILTVENLPRSDLGKLVILAAQFALEIKKVLLYEKVEELALTDGLTGLFVRRYFTERFNEEIYRSKRYKLKFAFIMLDIDDFKKCNDTYGHLVGDVVLKEIDLAARYGGEEFALVLPETTREGARLVAERIRKRVEENVFRAYDEKLNITVSIGMSIYPEDSAGPEGIIEAADAALYVAKKAGKNIVCEYKK